MATELVELGYAQRGRRPIIGRDSPQVISPFIHLYDFVDTFENPLSGSGLTLQDLDPNERAIVSELHRLSQKARMELVHPPRLGEPSALIQLSSIVMELGKKKKGIFSRVHRFEKHLYRKVSKVVKSPAFLSIAALAVNIVPGVGQVASVALGAAAASRKVYEQKAGEKKAVKKQKAADAQAQAAYTQQIIDYNRKTQAYYASQNLPVPANSYLDASGNPTSDPSKAPGLNVPAAGPSQQQLAQAVALSSAAALNDPSQAQGANALLTSVPPDVAQQAAQYVPGMAALASDPNMKPATVKAVGQFVAMQELAEGTGAGPLGGAEMGALASELKAQGGDDVQKAIAAGEQDLITSAAMEGKAQADAAQAAIKAGQSKMSSSKGGFPVVPVLLGIGGVAAVGTIVYFVA